MPALTATSRVRRDNTWISSRTNRALNWASKKSGVPISVSQGSWSTSVSASGNTHAGDGVVDIRVSSLNNTQRKKLVRALRDAGFAAWLRTPAQGFPYHVHAVLLSCAGASAAAKWQASQYDLGKDGLSRGLRDTDPYRPDARVRCSWLLNRPVKR